MAILTVILGLLTTVLRNFWPYILAGVLAIYCYHRVTSWWRGDSASDTKTHTAVVASLDSGNQLTIKSGLTGRQRHKVILYGLEIPDTVAEQAKDNLARYIAANDTVRLETIGKWKVFGDNTCIVLSENGTNVNINQLKMGLAKNYAGHKDFVWAEAEAKKNGIGIWKDNKPPKPRPFPWWRDEIEDLSPAGSTNW